MKKLLSTATETTPIINSRDNINSRRATERKTAITGMFIYVLLTVVTLVSLYYVNKKVDNDPKEPKYPTEPRSRPFIYTLLFSIYAIHPFFILIPLSWYFATPSQSLVWKEVTVWNVLFFLMAYVQFINSQLLYFVLWKTREMVCALLMAVLFFIYAVRLFWIYLWKSRNFDNEVRYRPID